MHHQLLQEGGEGLARGAPALRLALREQLGHLLHDVDAGIVRASRELHEAPGQLGELLGIDLPPCEKESAQAGKIPGVAPNDASGVAPNDASGVAPNDASGVAPNDASGVVAEYLRHDILFFPLRARRKGVGTQPGENRRDDGGAARAQEDEMHGAPAAPPGA